MIDKRVLKRELTMVHLEVLKSITITLYTVNLIYNIYLCINKTANLFAFCLYEAFIQSQHATTDAPNYMLDWRFL